MTPSHMFSFSSQELCLCDSALSTHLHASRVLASGPTASPHFRASLTFTLFILQTSFVLVPPALLVFVIHFPGCSFCHEPLKPAAHRLQRRLAAELFNRRPSVFYAAQNQSGL